MAFTDWDIFLRGGTALASLDLSTPIMGAGSLTLHAGNIGSSGALNLVPKTGELVYVKGYNKGRLRGLFRVIPTLGSPNAGSCGFSFMHTVRADITTFTPGYSNFYFVKATINSNGTISTLGIQKGLATTITGGVGGGSLTSLSSVIIPSIALNTIFSLQVDWFYDPLNLLGTYILVSYGSMTDFSGLTPVIQLIDTSSPLATSVGEGVYLADNSGVGTYKVQVDQMSLYQLVAD